VVLILNATQELAKPVWAESADTTILLFLPGCMIHSSVQLSELFSRAAARMSRGLFIWRPLKARGDAVEQLCEAAGAFSQSNIWPWMSTSAWTVTAAGWQWKVSMSVAARLRKSDGTSQIRTQPSVAWRAS